MNLQQCALSCTYGRARKCNLDARATLIPLQLGLALPEYPIQTMAPTLGCCLIAARSTLDPLTSTITGFLAYKQNG